MLEQRTPEWFAERCGKITASRIADLMAKTKSGYSTSRANYIAQLVVERMTGEPAESYSNAAMQWGTDNEPFARIAYEAHTGELIEEVGFLPHPDDIMAGASPDGLVEVDGLIEIKCPNTATHIDFLLTKKIPLKYELQMMFQMICARRNWCDYVSFDPRMPERHQFLCARFQFDPIKAAEIMAEVKSGLAEVENIINQLDAVK